MVFHFQTLNKTGKVLFIEQALSLAYHVGLIDGYYYTDKSEYVNVTFYPAMLEEVIKYFLCADFDFIIPLIWRSEAGLWEVKIGLESS